MQAVAIKMSKQPKNVLPLCLPPRGLSREEAAAYVGVSAHVTAPPQASEQKRGSFGHLCLLYYSSPIFKRLDKSTQGWRRRTLDAICQQHAHKPVALLAPRHIRLLRDERADKPGAANM